MFSPFRFIQSPLRHSQWTCRRSLSQSHISLSGHNKWSKIKQKKGVNDAQRGAVFGKANRDIVHAIRTAGGSTDPTKNLALAAVLKRCKEQDVPKENIEKAIAKATQGKGNDGESLTYEALAYGSVGVVIECLSDNATRTIHSIRDILNSYGARFAPVGFMFERKGLVKVLVNDEEQAEKLIEIGLEAGAEDFEQETQDGSIELILTCLPTSLAKLSTAVTASPTLCELSASELIYAPLESTEPSDDLEERLSKLVEALEANEDTLRVWTTLDS